MNWLAVAAISQIVLGSADVFDKLLLRRGFFDPRVYTFWLGFSGLFALVLLPFGFVVLPAKIILLALVAGAVFVLAIFALFFALHKGEASNVLPLVGGLTPVFTLFLSFLFLKSGLGLGEILGFSLLVFGGVLLLGTEKKELRWTIASLVLASAVLYGLANVLIKLVFEQSPFVTGFIWIKMGGVLTVFVFLLLPSFRSKVLAQSRESGARNYLLYYANRGYAAVGSLLMHGAIFLGHPALVSATGSLKYAVVFMAAWIFLRERPRGKLLLIKAVSILFIILGFSWFALLNYMRSSAPDSARPISWGITFSTKFSRELGLDWQKNFEAILQELKPKKLRLVAYWDEIEKEQGRFDFTELDWLLDKTRQAKSEVILVLGLKVPRWPECHIPAWAKNLGVEEREETLREYTQVLVERYKSRQEVMVWQVENEPFLWFGQCPQRGSKFLGKEIEVVKRADSLRPVLVTDSGELGLWFKAVKYGDVFGTTMYRKVFPRFIGPFFGVVEYPLPPNFFRLKEKMIRLVTGNSTKRFIVVELQGEPWGPQPIVQMSLEQQLSIFSPQYFQETIEYAKKTGFDEYYLWGAEWWYWLKEKHGDSRFWNEAEILFNK